MVTGVVLIALGFKKALEYVGDMEHHSLSDPLTGMPLYALFGGVALYLLAHVAFRLRNIHTLNRQRLLLGTLLLLLVPVASDIPALASLGLLAFLLLCLILYEVRHFAGWRHEVRHGEGAEAHA